MLRKNLAFLLFTVPSASASLLDGRRNVGASFVARRLQDTSDVSCNALKQLIEVENSGADGTLSVACSCTTEDDSTTTLTCLDDCEYCNADKSVCGSPGLGQVFDDTGAVTEVEESFTYTVGRDEVVTFTNSGCVQDGPVTTCETCEVFIDGEQCNSCTLITCTEGFNANLQVPSFDCSNIEDGNIANNAVLDLCDDPLVVAEGSVFKYLATDGDEYATCFRDTNAPSAPPSIALSMTPTFLDTIIVTSSPSSSPTISPTNGPTDAPTASPTVTESMTPTKVASMVPTKVVSLVPTAKPSAAQSQYVSAIPSDLPSLVPSGTPSDIPSDMPSLMPSVSPTVSATTDIPVDTSTSAPTKATTSAPTKATTSAPTKAATLAPVEPVVTPSPTDTPSAPPTETDSDREISLPSASFQRSVSIVSTMGFVILSLLQLA